MASRRAIIPFAVAAASRESPPASPAVSPTRLLADAVSRQAAPPGSGRPAEYSRPEEERAAALPTLPALPMALPPLPALPPPAGAHRPWHTGGPPAPPPAAPTAPPPAAPSAASATPAAPPPSEAAAEMMARLDRHIHHKLDAIMTVLDGEGETEAIKYLKAHWVAKLEKGAARHAIGFGRYESAVNFLDSFIADLFVLRKIDQRAPPASADASADASRRILTFGALRALRVERFRLAEVLMAFGLSPEHACPYPWDTQIQEQDDYDPKAPLKAILPSMMLYRGLERDPAAITAHSRRLRILGPRLPL